MLFLHFASEEAEAQRSLSYLLIVSGLISIQIRIPSPVLWLLALYFFFLFLENKVTFTQHKINNFILFACLHPHDLLIL